MFDPAAGDTASAEIASLAVWFDAFVTNVDRTARNPNLLKWHKELYFIDHGAALYFHHSWQNVEKMAISTFPPIRSHVLLPWASALDEADATAHTRLSATVFKQILDAVPDEWLPSIPDAAAATERRAAYSHYFSKRLAASANFVEEAKRVRAELI
jgi:hypothetical protein